MVLFLHNIHTIYLFVLYLQKNVRLVIYKTVSDTAREEKQKTARKFRQTH